MAYTTINDPTDYFNIVLYTGNAATPTNITGVGFQPDWVWIKNRSASENHILADSVRGANKLLESNTTDAELSDSNYIKAFQSDGFQIGSEGAVNGNSNGIVSWNWLGANGTASNSNGSITSTVSANTTSGFSIVSYTGTGSNATVGHGLGVAPKMIIAKKRSATGTWGVYHESIGNAKGLFLNSTSAESNEPAFWNSTSPTSSVFSVGTSGDINGGSATQIAYCFSEKQGYSKFSSYTGNGNANGPFVYTGFRPAFIIAKKTSSTSDWGIYDNKRNTFNVMDLRLKANSSGADDQSSDNNIDFLSNGFKHRTASGWNAAATYIYMAFAEQPFVTSTGVPATAR